MASTKRAHKKRSQSLNKQPFPYSKLFFSLLLVILGSFLILKSAGDKIIFATSSKTAEVQPQNQIGQKPIKLYIPQMSRILYVSDGYVEGDRWAISPTGVSYLTSSALPGKGNTVIYGHNTADILGGMWRVHQGDYIYVVLENGDFVKYQVFEEKEIDPTQVDILNQTDDSRLTLYTCSGFLDTARFVVVAEKVGETT